MMASSSKPRTAVVHIGTHKTGTTSFQHALSSAAERIEASGEFRLFRSRLTDVASWAFEVPLLVIRPALSFPLRRWFPDSSLESAQAAYRRHVLSEFSSEARTVILSQEALSLLRTEAEFNDLRTLFAESGRIPRFVVVLRNRDAFLRSYRAQLARSGMPTTSEYKDSISYTEPDSWLADTASLIHGYHRAFGADSLMVLKYEVLAQDQGSVVPALWRACGLPEYLLPADLHWLNRS
jgi:hypothetical protein